MNQPHTNQKVKLRCAKKQCEKEAELQTPFSSAYFPSSLNLCLDHAVEINKIALKQMKKDLKKTKNCHPKEKR